MCVDIFAGCCEGSCVGRISILELVRKLWQCVGVGKWVRMDSRAGSDILSVAGCGKLFAKTR